jgi:PAS domain-containing protein
MMDQMPEITQEDSPLRSIVYQNADGIVVVDDQGQVRFVNPAAERLLQRSETTLVGAEFGFPIIGNDRVEIEIIRQGQEHYSIAEMRVVNTIWDGQAAYLVSLRDVTAYKQALESLREAEAFNLAILNSLSNHIAVLDEQGIILATNDSWRNFAETNGNMGGTHASVGQNYFDVCERAEAYSPENAPEVVNGLRAVLSGERSVFELEYPYHTPQEERWFLLRALPLLSARQSGLLLSHTDITEQKRSARIAAEAEALRERLREREREFSAIEALSQTGAGMIQRMYGNDQPPLRTRNTQQFRTVARQYGAMLDEALHRRAYRIQSDNAGEIRSLAEATRNCTSFAA